MAGNEQFKSLPRRVVLKAAGAVVGVGVAGALAGCAPGQASTEGSPDSTPQPAMGSDQTPVTSASPSPEPTKQSEPTRPLPSERATVEPLAAVEAFSFGFGGSAELLDDPLGGPKTQMNVLPGDGTAVIDIPTGYIKPRGARVVSASVSEGLVRFSNGLLFKTNFKHREGLFPHLDTATSERYPFGSIGWVDKEGKEAGREDAFINPQKGEQVKFNPDTMSYIYTDSKGNERIEKVLPASLIVSAESLNVRSAPMVAPENVLPGFSLKSGDWVTPVAAAFDSNHSDRGTWLKLVMKDASGKKQNVWIAASYQGQTPVEIDEAFIKSLPKEDLPPAPKPEKTDEPTQEPKKEPQKALTAEQILNETIKMQTEMASNNTKLAISYSTEVLKNSGITEVKVDPALLDAVNDRLITDIHSHVGVAPGTKVKLAGTMITKLKEPGSTHAIEGEIKRIRAYFVTEAELSQLRNKFESQKTEYSPYNKLPEATILLSLMTFTENGDLIVIYRSDETSTRSIANPPDEWDRKDASFRLVFNGPGILYASLSRAMMNGQSIPGKDLPPDPAYNLLGCNSDNNFCRNGDRGKIEITFVK